MCSKNFFLCLICIILQSCSREPCRSIEYKYSSFDAKKIVEISKISSGNYYNNCYEIHYYYDDKLIDTRKMFVEGGIIELKENKFSEILVVLGNDTLVCK